MASVDEKSLKRVFANLDFSSELSILTTEEGENLAQRAEERFKEILSEEISKITINHSFMEELVGTVTIKDDNGFSITIEFKDRVHRRSVFYSFTGKEVYMPYVLNNEWQSMPKQRYVRKDEHGKLICTVMSFPFSNKGFMNRAVKRFNEEYSAQGVEAKANTNYK